MRSCALRILLAATISIACVIFCVFLMLLILVRISLAAGTYLYLLNSMFRLNSSNNRV